MRREEDKQAAAMVGAKVTYTVVQRPDYAPTGAGEVAIAPVPAAVANAVADALAAEGLPGLDPPFTEERLWRALNIREG